MQITVERLTPNRTDDFYAYHCDANDAGWCHCVAWWTPTWDDWPDRSAADNRALRDQLFTQGHYDGYLTYDDTDTPIGWAQVGPRDRLAKLLSQYKLDPEPEAWAITCFNIAPAHRRSGVARALLKHVIADLAGQGITRLQAFPRRGTEPDNDGALWTGPESLYLDAGFGTLRDDPTRLILQLDPTI